jgi:hypothetical protein
MKLCQLLTILSIYLTCAVEEAGVPGENDRPWQATGKLYHLQLRVECTFFCNLQSRVRTHDRIGDKLV